ncbi:craniofacial development protein 2-like [Amphiura filiformis]|uniref:craniofacial development protein 2-like n=1 Tax=Amphiura filiformis TaxID=82378 RepID=UPI003B217B60
MVNKEGGSLICEITQQQIIVIANFQGNPATTGIVTYCPTNVADEDAVENHYDSMRIAIESIPAHYLLIVMGDFNARVGLEDTKFTHHDTTHRNGKYLVELATEKNLIIANTQFRKKAGKLWTFTSPGGNKYQLDYILIRRKWRNSLQNAEAYNTIAGVGFDITE